MDPARRIRKNKVMRFTMNIIIGLVLIIVILPLILVYVNTHPPRYPLNVPPSRYQASFETVSFKSEDGIDLKGWLVAPASTRMNSPAIIICHGLGANKSDFSELGASLARRGYYVLLFDFRAHGDSGGSRTSLGLHEQTDIAAALGFLQQRPDIDPDNIGIYGFSLGGSSAVLAAARLQAFAAIVADSAFTSLREQAKAAITGFYRLPSFPFLHLASFGYELYFQTGVDRIAPVSQVAHVSPAPILIIAGDGDELIPAENGRKLFAAAREPKLLWIVPGADHGGTLMAAGNEYEKRVGEFFDTYLK